ncbi:MAG: bifunctional serine/threonine-protein kinase/formylglycine-generating enzyme family protein [bacterium]|nr:bifunctional serine/threonine-protein kinase/formylglycine-generating enzyme family protein [bacterium]
MDDTRPTISDPERSEELLEELLVQCIELGEGDGIEAVEKLLAAHPEQAAAVRELLGSLAGLGFLGDSTSETPAIERIGAYRLLRRLGEGSMGVVYLARHDATNRVVALKTIRQLHAGSTAQERFRREALAIARLRHPNVVTVFDAGEYDGVAYLAMELLSGRSLDEVVRDAAAKSRLLPVDEVARWGLDLAEALACAHAAEIIHRDVKPSNVRITAEGRAVLLDFGLARDNALAEQLTVTGSFQGSPNFASPEQIEGGQSLDARTDVFSLGVTLHCCLTNAMPFDGETREQVFRRILTEAPPSPRRINPAVSRDLATIVEKAMEKRPDQRYATAAALAEDLRALLEHRPIAARPAGPIRRTLKWIRRRPAAATAAACGILLVIGLATGLAVALGLLDELRTEKKKGATSLAVLTMRDLPREEGLLWPATPERVAGPRGMDSWLSRAHGLLAALPGYEARLAELQELAKERDPETAAAHAELARRIARYEERIRKYSKVGAAKRQLILSDRASIRVCQQRRLRSPPDLGDPELVLLYGELVELVGGIPALAETIARVERRREFALTIADRIEHDFGATWQETIAAVASDPRYDGLQLRPQPGLIPVGPDPQSGLQEFAHPLTGEVPRRGPDGELDYTSASGVVFILVPGGTFTMGSRRPGEDGEQAPNVDPYCVESYESPPHEITIAPFFLGKFEMTQAQWVRITGSNPAGHCAGTQFKKARITDLHPIESISYLDAVRWLGRMGCRLPTEAQWEYAARAGTTTVWWTGNDRRSLIDAANLADQHPHNSGEARVHWEVEDWDDGFTHHAPVGSFRPNAFGLHDVCGNVSEWCRDWYGGYGHPAREGDGYRTRRDMFYVTARSGSFSDPAPAQRMARRLRFALDFTYPGLGVRPSLGIKK